ncbi:hypothetical protein BJY04DRAFT_185390 [Aspergillus karnatakaensis]|uniref:uncharacterized protein n=1 Tax=Aspergillus karnatakaensis TaxID=1810916 RepID=UPI003CCCB221
MNPTPGRRPVSPPHIHLADSNNREYDYSTAESRHSIKPSIYILTLSRKRNLCFIRRPTEDRLIAREVAKLH